MITDVHTHLGTDRMSITSVTKDSLATHVYQLLQQMNTNGVDRALLAPLEPHVNTLLCLQAADMQPSRLMAACSIAPRPIESARSMLKEMQDKGCMALLLDDEFYFPQDPAVYYLINQAVDADIPVFFHTYNLTTDIATMINNVTLLHQTGRFVICHMGGLFGFHNALSLLNRDNIWLEISITLPRIVESLLKATLDSIIQELGVKRLVFGSENHSDYSDIRASLNRLRLNVEAIRNIMSDNAEIILGNLR